MKKINRRKAIKNLGISAALLSIGGIYSCRPKSQKQEGIKSNAPAPLLTSGYIPILDSVPLVVGYAKGFFQELNIDVEKPKLIRGWPALMEAFTSKQILLTHILLPQVIFLRYAQNIKLKSVAYNHTDVVAMLVAKEIGGIKDLGGKIVGCPTWWAPHTGIFQDVIRAAGLIPVAGKKKEDLESNEVGFRVVAPPDMAESLKSGAISGCTVSEPFGAACEVLAGAKLVKVSGDVWHNHPCCQSVMLEDTINRDREWSQKVTNAIYKSAIWAHNNREELAELLGKDGGGYFPMPVKVVKKALLDHDMKKYGPEGTGAIMHSDWNVKRVEFMPYPYKSAFTTTKELMDRMVVDESAKLPKSIASLTGEEIANEIVDYKLAQKGFEVSGGAKAFNLLPGKEYHREEKYDVLLK